MYFGTCAVTTKVSWLKEKIVGAMRVGELGVGVEGLGMKEMGVGQMWNSKGHC